MSANSYTVVIPAFNAEKYIEETLRSVLDQTILPQKIIVVDDGSTDSTAEIAAEYHTLVEVIRTKNRGPAAATTTGINEVTSSIFATLDSDDLWVPNKMETQLKLLNDPDLELDAVLCRMRPFGEIDKKIAPEENSGWTRSTLSIKTDAFHRVGPVEDLGNGYAEMIDWFARAKQIGLIFYLINKAYARRRIHSESLSFKAGQGQTTDMLKAAIRAIERRERKH